MSYSKYKIKLNNKIWDFFKDYFYFNRISDSNLIQNLNYYGSISQKKVLICYLTKGYFVNVEKNLGRTILYEIFKIIKIFSETGYCIDIVNCNESKSIPIISEKRYDLIFGFGETFYQMTRLQPTAISILYMTENPPKFSYREEKKRLDYYYLRHSKLNKIQRSGNFYKVHHLDKKYSQVITLGETELLTDQYVQPFHIFPTGIINPKYNVNIKNQELGRKNFLWLGSSGAIHKGLDLLIDVFKTREDITLHICGLTNKDRAILCFPKRKNIVEYGFIDIKSDAFLKIIETCSYSILPSCSEGCATSITTSMLNGLIPVVMRDVGFNRLYDKAIFLEDYRVEYIDMILTKLSNDPSDLISAFSKKVLDFAHKEFSISTFEKNFRNIINNIEEQNNESSTYSKTSANFGQRSF